jgi:hypothetical protein
MNAELRSFVVVLVVGFLGVAQTRAQEDDLLKDPDFQAALKQAQELQKKNPPVKMSDLQKQADDIQAEQKKEEQKEKAALQKQLQAPGPLALPDWTPATPEFKATGSVTKKIVDDHVAITQIGTSSRTPQELADAWEAAIADKKINHVRNNISSNNNLTTILFLTTRTDPREEVRMEARRPAGAKTTQVTISSPLPKPEDEESD